MTHFEVLESFGQAASLLACRLETGRTHQIRIHLAEIGHPVLGDRVYRPRKAPRFPIPFRRQALHARHLGFVHPITGEAISRRGTSAGRPGRAARRVSVAGK